jgi:ABC-2 type transport system permease protein
VPVGAFAAARIAAMAAEEVDRRLTLLYAQPVTRQHVLTAESAVTAAGCLALALTAAAAVWAGTAAVDAPLELAAALAGAFNILPVVLLCLGAAVFALGWLPRAVVLVGSLPAAGGFVLHVAVLSTHAPAWVGRLSPYAHLAPVPATAPNWTAAAVMTLGAVILASVGAYGYTRRDLRG